MAPNDMVVLIGIEVGSTAWIGGLRIGAIGTIIKPCNFLYCMRYDWEVQFKGYSLLCMCPSSFLRKIDPPEAADGWKYCVFKPKVKELETI